MNNRDSAVFALCFWSYLYCALGFALTYGTFAFPVAGLVFALSATSYYVAVSLAEKDRRR